MKKDELIEKIKLLLTTDEEIVFASGNEFFTNLGVYHYDDDKIKFYPAREIKEIVLKMEKPFFSQKSEIVDVIVIFKSDNKLLLEIGEEKEAIEIQNIIKELYLI